MVSEFAEVFGDWFAAEPVSVETYSGGGFDGVTYSAAQPVGDLMVERKQKLVRAADGNERMSMAQLYVEPAAADAFTLHSRVTLAGETHTVMQIDDFDVFGLPGHKVVFLE